MREIFINIDIVMILVETFLINFIVSQAELVVNIVAVSNFKWSIGRLSAVTLVGTVLSVATMKLVQRLKTGEDAYFLINLCLVGNWITLCVLVLVTNFSITWNTLQTAVVLSALFLDIIPGFNSAPWSLTLLYMIVPEHSRCFISGLRQASGKVACAFGYFTAASMFSLSAYVYPVLEICCFALTLFFLGRRKKFFKLYQV